jgi:fructosamine-3-kinase
MLTPGVRRHLLDCIAAKTGDNGDFKSARPVGGGSINDAYAIQTDREKYFVKLNSASAFPGMFEAEKRGLEILRNAGGPAVPAVIDTGSIENSSFIIMQFRGGGTPRSDFHETFGKSLATLHRNHQELFGLDHDNYIGSLTQSNRQHHSGADFFIEERIRPQLKLAIDDGKLPATLIALSERFIQKLTELLPPEPASLLHGDLWSGNYICGPDGNAWLIDPAVYFGYREADLAMTRLFGGFNTAFYNAYDAVYPLLPGWEERIALFNLYPLLVHTNLFGGGYATSAVNVMRQYAG